MLGRRVVLLNTEDIELMGTIEEFLKHTKLD